MSAHFRSWCRATCLVATLGSVLLARTAAAEQPVRWTSAVGVDGIGGQTLRKLAATGWGNAGAVSWESILEDGYIFFRAGDATKRMVGLSHGNTDESCADIDFGLLLADGELSVYESGAWKGDFGSYESLDILYISVTGGVVTYARNGTILYTSTQTPTFPLLVDTALYAQGSTIPPPYIASTRDVLLKPVDWTSAAGVAVSGSSLRKTAATAWGNAGAVSTQTIPGMGYVEFIASETTSYRMLGLSHENTNNSWDDIDFALYLYEGQIKIYEAGVFKGNFGSYATGDRLIVNVNGGIVSYIRNGTILYWSSKKPAFPLLVDCALYSQDATLDSVWISGVALPRPLIQAVVWTDLEGVAANDNNLTKTASTGWGNAGAVSWQVITDHGYVEFTASETNTYRMLGLSEGNRSSSWDDIDHALYLYGGQIKIYESGVFKGNFGSYATGDALRIDADCRGGFLQYRRNDATLYASRFPMGACPLLVDTALYSQNSTLTSVGIYGGTIYPVQPQLSVTKDGAGTASGRVTSTPAGIDCGETCSARFAGGTSVALTAIASADSGFLGWNGAGCSGTGTCVVTMDDAKSVKATFVPFPVLSIDDVTVAEGDAGSADAVLTVTLSPPADQTVAVNFATVDGTATSGSDYTTATGRLIFAPGETSHTISVPVMGDTDAEPSETILVDLSNISGAGVADGHGTVTIANDDAQAAEPVVWTNRVGVTATGSTLIKTTATAWGNAGAISVQTIVSGDGYVEFTASETNTYRMLGLSHGNTNSSFEDIDFSLYLSGGQIQVYEAGSLKGTFGSYATGDTLRVAVSGGAVTYARNGTVFCTSVQVPVYPLLVDSALFSQNATLGSALISGATVPPPPTAEAVVWTGLAGVAANGSSLTKTASTAWGNAGAISTRAIASGDGYVEFTASETSTYRMLGLSKGNTNSSFEDIDFSLYLSGGQIQVYEAGSPKGTFGGYVTGDMLRVAVSGGTVSYSRNGTVFYRSSRTPAYPLLVDCALHSQNGTLSSVVLAGAP